MNEGMNACYRPVSSELLVVAVAVVIEAFQHPGHLG